MASTLAGRVDALGVVARLAHAFATPADPDDPDQVDVELIREVAPLIDSLCTAWYRLEIEGMERVPTGPALLVLNHESGISFIELLGWGARWYRDRPGEPPLAGLGHDAMFAIPGLGNFLVRAGGVRASQANADAVFSRGRKVVVAPGGNREAFRAWRERGRVKLGGHDGFARLALRHRVPVVPMVFNGGHEGFVVLDDGAAMVRRMGTLARRLRVDTWPLFLGLPWGVAWGPAFHLPLPTKVRVRMLDAIPTDPYPPGSDRDPAAVSELYRTVWSRMQAAKDDLQSRRRWPVLG
jgi:1-acyl-sn-glycerol-3-phosphate acyltransferase